MKKIERKLYDYTNAVEAMEAANYHGFGSLESEAQNNLIAICQMSKISSHEAQVKAKELLEMYNQSRSLRKNAQTLITIQGKKIVDRVRTHKTGKTLRDLYIINHLRLSSYMLLKDLAIANKNEEIEIFAQELINQINNLIQDIESNWSLQKAIPGKKIEYTEDMFILENDYFIMLTTLTKTTSDKATVMRLNEERDETKEMIRNLKEWILGFPIRKGIQGALFAAGKGSINLIRHDKNGKNARDLITATSIKIAGYELLLQLNPEPELQDLIEKRLLRDREVLSWAKDQLHTMVEYDIAEFIS